MLLKFRGYNNPIVKGHTSYFGEGEFTIGKIYGTSEKIDMYGSDNIHKAHKERFLLNGGQILYFTMLC